MKILILRFSSIGDIVLTTPIIRCIKQQIPHAEIHFCTKEKFKSVIENNPHIDKFYFFNDDIQPTVLQLVKENYRYCIDLHNNIRTFYVKSMLRQVFNSQVTCYTFNKLNIKKSLYTTFKINVMPDKSIVERYFETVKKIGVKNDGQGLDFFYNQNEELKKEDLPFSHSQGYIVFSIGGQHETKKMPIAKWVLLAQQIQFPIIIIGGKEDEDNARIIAQTDAVKIYNACGKFSIGESAQIIQKANTIITHDTGMMHIAAAYKKNIISIWGNTTPLLGMFPYYGYNNLKSNIAPQLSIIENSAISCRPCSKIGYKKCPKKHFNCMNQINEQEIILALNKSLGK